MSQLPGAVLDPPRAGLNDAGWEVVSSVQRRHGDVEREDRQARALVTRLWGDTWNSERDRSYRSR